MRIPLLILTCFSLVACDNTTTPDTEPTARTIDADPIEFTTSDGFLIRGTFFHAPTQTTAQPAIILLHPFGQNHLDWFAFAPDLVDLKGFVALAIDLRGHGQSTFKNGQSVPIQNFTFEDLNNMPLDVEAAIAYLKTRPEADATHVGVVGADIGANIAFVSAGTLPEVQTAVSISPQFRENQEQQILIGTNLPNFAPKNILFIASYGDGYAYTSSETMAALTQGTKRIIGLQGLGHGMDLLTFDETWNDVMNWLSENLR